MWLMMESISNVSFEIDPIYYILLAGAGLVGLYKMYGKPRVLKFQDFINNVSQIPLIAHDISEIKTEVSEIKKEVFADGGSSFRDAVDRIEARIITVEEKQNIHLMDARHGVFETDKAGKWVTVNRTLCRLFKVSEKEILGNGWKNFVGEPDMIARFNHCMANEIEFKMLTTFSNSKGESFSVSVVANPLRFTKDKSMIGYLGTIDLIPD